MLSRPFLVLFGAVLVASMGISMVSPILPVYAESLGATGIWIGLTFSIFAVSQTLVSPFAGRWSDRYGRKPFIVLGLLCYFIAAFGYLTADTFWVVLAFRAFSGCGTSMVFAVGQAYLGDIVPRGQEGRWFGMFSVADITGFGIGPVLSGVLRDLLGFDSVFIGMALLMGAAALLVFVLLPENRSTKRRTAGTSQSVIAGMAIALRHRVVVAVVLFMGLTSVTYGAVFAFLAVFLDNMGVSATAIGVAFGSQFVAGAITQPLFGRLADRVDRRHVLLGGLAACAITLAGLGAAPNYATVLALLVILGAANAASWVAAGAIQVVAGRRAGMGTVIGLGAAGDGMGILVGGVAGGAFAGWLGAAAAFYFGAGALAMGLVLLGWLLWSLPWGEVNADPERELELSASFESA
jgi:MFS transporter, DHA1 family, multidrug resistance protein